LAVFLFALKDQEKRPVNERSSGSLADGSYWPKSDIPTAAMNVCFWGKSRHRGDVPHSVFYEYAA